MTFNSALKGLVELGIEGIFDKKRAEFVHKLRETDISLMRQQISPENDTRTPPKLEAKLATMAYHQWISEQLANNQGSRLGKGYAAIYFDIAHPDNRGTYFRLGELAAQVDPKNAMVVGVHRELTSLLSRAQATVQSILGDLPNRPRGFRFGGGENPPYGNFRYDELPWTK